MAANTGERTLIATLIPPGPAHINGVHTVGAGPADHSDLVVAAASMASLLGDCGVRTTPKSEILHSVVQRLPVATDPRVRSWLLLRALRLDCLTDAYAQLWSDCYHVDFSDDRWTEASPVSCSSLSGIGPTWTERTPLRRAVDRRRAVIEIDALVALALDISANELCSVYRTQFPVLSGYDRVQYVYDRNGRVVPTSLLSATRRSRADLPEEDRTVVHPGSGVAYVYEPPFSPFDREGDLRAAYAEFEGRIANRSEKTA